MVTWAAHLMAGWDVVRGWRDAVRGEQLVSVPPLSGFVSQLCGAVLQCDDGQSLEHCALIECPCHAGGAAHARHVLCGFWVMGGVAACTVGGGAMVTWAAHLIGRL